MRGGECMRRILSLLLVLAFGLSQTAFAGVAKLSDNQMEDVNAGDWIVVGEDPEVFEGWYNNNDIALEDESQMEINAISNANAVDSAVAVQTNALNTAEGDGTAVARNEANLLNYNPSDASASSNITSTETSFGLAKGSSLEASSSLDISKAAGMFFGNDETLDVNETLNITGAYASAGETEDKSGDSEFATAAALLVDYDKIIDYDNHTNAGSFCKEDVLASEKLVSSSSCKLDVSDKLYQENTTYNRKNLSENNHITLEDTAQKNIYAISNLNAVGASAAVQTNAVNSVAGNANLNLTNIATAVNGL